MVGSDGGGSGGGHDSSRRTRVFCYGDSLTMGYHKMGLASSPYSAVLTSEHSFNVSHCGLPGWTAEQLADHFPTAFADASPGDAEGCPWAWVVVLCGTNDLARPSDCGGQPSSVFSSVQRVWEQAEGCGARVVAVTVPPLRERGDTGGVQPSQGDGLAVRRDELNRLIRTAAQARGAPCADFAALLAHGDGGDAAAEAARRRLFDDNVHMSPAGYRLLGDLVARTILAAASK